MNPLLVQLTHRPFPEVAGIIRSEIDRITLEWDFEVRKAMPQMRHLTFDELKDSTPQILAAIADALASDDPDVIAELVARAPAQGLSRFRLNFDVAEVMQEDRLLRSITVRHVDAGLGRPMHPAESAALHAVIDVMLQRSVIALVDQQKFHLRAAAETELRFLSFLSHDLNNNLNNVTLSLDDLGYELQKAGVFNDARESLSVAQDYIHDTVAGMRRMLDHARLRKSDEAPAMASVDLHALATKVNGHSHREAQRKGVRLAVEVPPGSTVQSDGDLVSLVLQNLVGNGIKYSSAGTVRIGFGDDRLTDRPFLTVSDEGPGIASEKLDHIFDAFRRGDPHGQDGLGLGLAIASQAAVLLGAELTVRSEVGAGSTFRLTLPGKGQTPVETVTRTVLVPV
jgi:signal transduction histidine kinase